MWIMRTVPAIQELVGIRTGRISSPTSTHRLDLFSKHLKRMHLGSNIVTVSKVGLATHSASDGPYMDTYLVHQTEGVS